MAEQPKSSKFDFQKIINDVKSIISPAPIPEANKDDPVGYHLSEMNKMLKELAEYHTKQADIMSKISATLGALYQAVKPGAAPSQPTAAKSEPAASCPIKEAEKAAKEPATEKATEEPKEEE